MDKSNIDKMKSIMFKEVDLDSINAKIDETYKKNNNKIRLFIIVLTILVILFIVLSYKLGNIGYSPVAFSEVDNITLKEENTVINHNARINIFGADKIEDEFLIDGFRAIYPSVSGEYKFSIKNETIGNMKYNVDFIENATAPINMKFRLKMDNIYIKGDKDTYLSIDEIDLKDIVVPRYSINIYTLEWCWIEDDEKDSQVLNSKKREYYSIQMKISSSPYYN